MKKINSLIKYEFINLRRGVLLWIIPVLYIFGVQQDISAMLISKDSVLSLVGLINALWLPLNFIFIPILLIGIILGSSDNDVFKTIDISHKQITLSKVIPILIIDGVILVLNIIIMIVVGIMCNLTLGYFMTESIVYIVNAIVSLLFCSFLGLFLGKIVSKRLGVVIAYIIAIISFILFTNFYKTSNNIFPLFNIRTASNSFDIISYDKSYIYHNLFWLLITFILSIFIFHDEYEKEKEFKSVLLRRGSLILASGMCLYLAINIFMMLPTFYDIEIVSQISDGNTKRNFDSFINDKNCGYYVDKYNMNININDKLNNDCNMEIQVNKDNLKSVELGLYKKLNISNIEVDNKKLQFKRTNNSFIVSLPRNYKNGEKINMEITYKGEINTTWLNGEELFFARSNGIFLADVFEWYPKLNDREIKEYNLDIKYKGKNKIYSNLDDENTADEYKLNGKDKEIFLISGNITERKYKNYLFIGNEEEIHDDKQCDSVLNHINADLVEEKKIFFVPFIPGEGLDNGENYKKVNFCTMPGFSN